MTKKINHIGIVLLVCIIGFNVACTQRAAPVISSRTTEPLRKQKSVAAITPDMVEGKTIFINRCGKCHDLPLPGQFTAQRWEGILSYMIPRARLTDEQGIHVAAYLKSNAVK